MAIDEYKKVCADLINNIPPKIGAMEKFFIAKELIRLYNLTNEGAAEDRAECFKYWLELPVDEEVKREVLGKVKERKR
jgi:hypothetical protein